MTVLLRGDRPLHGRVRPTSDKSISHRAVILAGLAEGTSAVDRLNPGADVASTAACLEMMGVRIERSGVQAIVHGRAGTLRCPTGVLDCGNSGTTMRLLAGVIASQEFTATLDGDESLRNRPMRRVAIPLRGLGARVEGPDNAEHAPLIVTGPVSRGGSFSSPVASAQIKSAALLAGALGGKRVRVEEPGMSRDHTERMLNAFGIECRFGDGFALVDPEPGQRLRAVDLTVPADPSAAALLCACAAAVPGSRIELDDVLLNPRRTGFLEVLSRMGIGCESVASAESGGEKVGRLDITAPESFGPTHIAREEVPRLVDEVPALAALAAFGEGTTVFEGVGELRVKESDRLASISELLAAFGVESRVDDDRLEVVGGAPRFRGELPSTSDHRILMAAAILGTGVRARGQEVRIELDPAAASVSDPAFFDHLQELDGAARG
jgi:3-phosphoshikimate 1-carboxyvinyltransferase